MRPLPAMAASGRQARSTELAAGQDVLRRLCYSQAGLCVQQKGRREAVDNRFVGLRALLAIWAGKALNWCYQRAE